MEPGLFNECLNYIQNNIFKNIMECLEWERKLEIFKVKLSERRHVHI